MDAPRAVAPSDRVGAAVIRLLGVAAATVVALSLVLVLAAPTTLRAHATLVRTHPGPDAVLAAAPAAIRLWFSERLEQAFHSVTVTDGKGREMPTRNLHLDRTDPTQLTVGVELLPPGVYLVRWRVLSRDGHVAEGAFSFSIHP